MLKSFVGKGFGALESFKSMLLIGFSGAFWMAVLSRKDTPERLLGQKQGNRSGVWGIVQ